jgi:hypothetical protein
VAGRDPALLEMLGRVTHRGVLEIGDGFLAGSA